MAGIINTTARQFNLKVMNKERRIVTIRIAPGFNVVDDDHWESFVPKNGQADPYVSELKKKGFLRFGDEENDMELDVDPDTQSKSTSKPIPRPNIAKET
tara:strand:+ start:44 stop:340 length:297 start_codon:yes stop_codon:yes gene_type:complete